MLFVYLWLSSSCTFQKTRDVIPQLLKISGCHLMCVFILLLSLKKSSHAPSCIFSSPLCSCWHQHLYSCLVVSGRVARLTTTTLWYLPGKNCFLASLIPPSHVLHQLLTRTQGTKQDCRWQRQCQLRVFLQLQTDGCSLSTQNSSLVWNT